MHNGDVFKKHGFVFCSRQTKPEANIEQRERYNMKT